MHDNRAFGIDEDTRRIWLPLWAGLAWAVFLSLNVAGGFVDAWGDFMRGPIAPPRTPLPGADSAFGFALLTMVLAYLPFVVPAALLRYTYWRDEDDAWRLFHQVLDALVHISSLGIVSRRFV